MRHRSRAFPCLGLALSLMLAAGPARAEPGEEGAAAPGTGGLVVTVTGLRSGQGQVLACLVHEAAAFPDCSGHASARHQAVPAVRGMVILDFGSVPPGTYAIALFHDENGNGRLDKFAMIPREGYGFSRDAPVRFGPPRFAAAAFAVGQGRAAQVLKMRYLFGVKARPGATGGRAG